ncbi:hypothetical protein MNB_SV-9-1386 [hydrothermal vent metagenome]|uniref:Uncharacterized protein n=1 Tax=hydrothermal vent metagenome TaxID=652676 RepID=A0A1W1BE73_9ZZZZ
MQKQRVKREPNGISLGLFFKTIFIMGIVVFFSVIKIYLANQIYYESRRINYIQREVSALEEENVMLQNQLQAQKFKNCVSDVSFYAEFEDEETP